MRGPGISLEKHAVIFEKFRQVDASVTRTHSGTGLGLAISKELITLLGGSIGVGSEPGKGSTFWVVLPLKNEAGTQDLREKLTLSQGDNVIPRYSEGSRTRLATEIPRSTSE